MSSMLRPSAALAACLLLPLAPAVAQCAGQWLPGDPLSTPRGAATTSTLWDPDGAGPLPSVLVVGGPLDLGAQPGPNAYAYDGATWSRIDGAIGPARVVAVWNGELYAVTSGSLLNSMLVQRYDGSAWQVIGSVQGDVRAMAVFNNQLIVGGSFSSVGGTTASSIASWNGTTWSPLGAGVTGTVLSLAVFGGSLRVGGAFTAAGGQPAGNLAVWSGASWSIGPFFDGRVDAMAVRNSTAPATTYLFVGGAFTGYTLAGQSFAAPRIARLDALNNTWSAVGTGLPGQSCTSLGVRNVGLGYEVIAGLEDASSMQRCWRFASNVWSPMGTLPTTPMLPVYTLAFYGGRWIAGTFGNGQPAIYEWNGSAWLPVLGQGIPGEVFAVAAAGAELVIGGSFARAGGNVVANIARGTPTNWAPLGSGVAGGAGVFAVLQAQNGDIVAGGSFTTAGGAPASNVARWDGAGWQPLGSGTDGAVYALLELPNGDLIAGGDFFTAGGVLCSRIARWNGSTWSPLGSGFGLGFDLPVRALARLADGSLVAGGDFLFAGAQLAARIARWNGSSWSTLGGGCSDSVFALAVAPDGALYAGGRFTAAGGVPTRVGRWANGAWTAVDSTGITGDVRALAVHPSGDLFVGGAFPGGSTLRRIRSNGPSIPMAVGQPRVHAIVCPDGDVVVGGAFEYCSTQLSVNVARFDTPCPATATVYGTGCAGLTAPLALDPLVAPWVGGAWRLRAATLGPGGVAVRVLGTTPVSLPLVPLLPGALPGCVGLTTPDDLAVVIPVQGVAEFGGSVPPVATLVGASLRAQVLQLELAGSGFAISSSDAVTLVVGAL